MTADDTWQHWTAPEHLLAELDRLRAELAAAQAENARLATRIADDEQRIRCALLHCADALAGRITHHVHLAHCVDAALTQGRAVTRGPCTCQHHRETPDA
jgi:hypothetical protein